MQEEAQDEQNCDEDPATTPFARFEDLARKLVSVPKEEVDALLAKNEKEKRSEES
jgi:hypothetical protein